MIPAFPVLALTARLILGSNVNQGGFMPASQEGATGER
jgi:hypothetical protein